MENDSQPSSLSSGIAKVVVYGSLVFAGFALRASYEEERLAAGKPKILFDTIYVDSNQVAATVTSKDPLKFVDTVFTQLDSSENSVVSVSVNDLNTPDSLLSYKLSSKEWKAFDDTWKYDDLYFTYSERDVTILTNIVYKESRSWDNIPKIIDQYMVVIGAARKCQSSYNSNVTEYTSALRSGKCRQFSWREYFLKPKSGDRWEHSKNIVLNVLNNNIPAYVPYMPHGGGYYWNSRIDTNRGQRLNLEKKYAIVFSSIKDHHFFVPVEALLQHERDYLVKHGCTNNVPKNISNGIFCK